MIHCDVSFGFQFDVTATSQQGCKTTLIVNGAIQIFQIGFINMSQKCRRQVSQIQLHHNLNAMYLKHAFETY